MFNLIEHYDVQETRRLSFEEGFKEGYEEGFLEGFEEGFIEGYEEGFFEGFEEGKWGTLQNMIKSHFSLAQMKAVLALPEAEVTRMIAALEN